MKNKLYHPKLISVIKEGISKKQLTSDVLAGIVVGIVALPLSIAFAVASGVSPDRGLITAIVAGALISVLGGSRVQIGGPTGAFIVIIVGIVNQYGVDGLMISTLLAGVILIAFGLLKLGNLLKYFPHPLIVGFTSGIALVIFSTQVKDALGIPIEKVPASFIEKWVMYVTMFAHVNYSAIFITILSILLTVFTPRFIKRIPGSLLAILVSTPLVYFLHLPVTTIETFFGEIPHTIQLHLPTIQFSELHNYITPALTIALLGGIESLLSAVVSDGMIGGHHRSNTELIGQGIANLVTPFFGGIPATGALARTATNVKNGGRTPIAGIIHAITLMLIMLFLGKWAKLIPMSTLAGILIVVSYNMSEWRSFVSILKGPYTEIIVLLTTFALTVFVDLTVAIEIGVVLSALLFMRRMADIGGKEVVNTIDSDIIEDYHELPPTISIFEISGPLFFASARQYSELIEQIGLRGKILILRMRHVNFVDLTAMQNLIATLKTLQHSGVRVLLSGVKPGVLNDFNKSGITNREGENCIFDSFDAAVNKAKALVD